MALTWSHSIDSLDWEELSALFEACPPMGNKNPADLKTPDSTAVKLNQKS